MRCTDCDATWDAPSAVYCGDCGARLTADDDRRPRLARVRIPARLRSVGAVCAVVAAAVAVATVLTDPSLRPAGDASVEVRGLGEVAGRLRAADPVRCIPESCERWRASTGSGPIVVADRLVVHVGERTITARDVADGRVAWRRERAVATTSDEPHLTAMVRDTTLLVISPRHGVLDAYDLHDGRPRWRRDGGASRRLLAVADVDGALLVARDDPSGAGVTVLRLEDETGDTAWAHDATWLAAPDGDQWSGAEREPTLVVDEDSDGFAALTALDPRTGEVRWRREGPAAADVVAGHVVLVRGDGDGSEVLDLVTGETLLAEPTTQGAGVRVLDATWALVNGPSPSLWDLSRSRPVDVPTGDLIGAVATADGVVVATRRPEAVEVAAFDTDGALAWSRLSEGDTVDLVWALTTRGDDTVQLAGRGVAASTVLRLDAATGRPVDGPDGLRRDPVVVHDEGDRWIVAHRGGTFVGSGRRVIALDARVDLVHPRGPLLVRAGDELLALDETLLDG